MVLLRRGHAGVIVVVIVVVMIMVVVVVMRDLRVGALAGGLQPMLVDVGLQVVAGWPAVVVPQRGLLEAHLVEHAPGQAGLVVGELLGIAEGALHGGHHAGLAAQVPGRAAMPERRPLGDAHRLARREPVAGAAAISDLAAASPRDALLGGLAAGLGEAVARLGHARLDLLA